MATLTSRGYLCHTITQAPLPVLHSKAHIKYKPFATESRFLMERDQQRKDTLSHSYKGTLELSGIIDLTQFKEPCGNQNKRKPYLA